MGDRAGLRWAPLPLGVGAFMIWNVAAAGTTMVGRSLVEIRETFSGTLVALVAAAGLLAVLGRLALGGGSPLASWYLPRQWW